MKTGFFLATVLSLTSCASKSLERQRQMTSEQNSEIQTALDEAQATGSMPAIGLMVWKEKQNIYFNAQGKRALQKSPPVSLSDQWHLGSNTKAMTAFLIALAVQERKISYDTQLVNFFKDEMDFNSLNKDLTVSDLLIHQSGLKDVLEVQSGELWKSFFHSQDSVTKQRMKLAKAVLSESPHLDPKNKDKPSRTYSYGNSNYIVLGAILEKIYSLDWESLIMQKIFAPIKMNSCGFGVPGDFNETEPSQPWSHKLIEGKLLAFPPREKPDNPPMMGPAGTVHCNLQDWQKFIIELSATWDGNGMLLKNKSIIERYFENSPQGTYTYGGWGRIDGRFKFPIFTHDGSNTFNYSVAVFSPSEKSGILIVTNTSEPESELSIEKLKVFLARKIFQSIEKK